LFIYTYLFVLILTGIKVLLNTVAWSNFVAAAPSARIGWADGGRRTTCSERLRVNRRYRTYRPSTLVRTVRNRKAFKKRLIFYFLLICRFYRALGKIVRSSSSKGSPRHCVIRLWRWSGRLTVQSLYENGIWPLRLRPFISRARFSRMSLCFVQAARVHYKAWNSSHNVGNFFFLFFIALCSLLA